MSEADGTRTHDLRIQRSYTASTQIVRNCRKSLSAIQFRLRIIDTRNRNKPAKNVVAVVATTGHWPYSTHWLHTNAWSTIRQPTLPNILHLPSANKVSVGWSQNGIVVVTIQLFAWLPQISPLRHDEEAFSFALIGYAFGYRFRCQTPPPLVSIRSHRVGFMERPEGESQLRPTGCWRGC